ncbi:hypothetical protein [Paenibacillus urinalis]|uniref:PH domain-containing protein n=1 Tax=Paenibacillus urinalis TaxID=521520 RepID=A0AAX3MSZ8_9BACL|nr:hypothetical protein [Paenibacillus urinalis]WDH80740.1 hypothetical protein PUW23_14405 [Paenibacillus urinalis]
MSSVLQELSERKVLPSYWIYIFELYVIGMLLSLSLTAGPVILVLRWPTVWSVISLIAIPAGIFFFIKLWNGLKQWIWRNNHLDHFQLHEDRLEFTLWDRDTKERSEGSLHFSEVTDLYYGRHVVSSNYIYKKHKKGERYENISLLPVLYFVYQNGSEEMAVALPFDDEREANRWLELLSTKHISLSLTSVVTVNFQQDPVPEEMKADTHLTRAEFNGNIEWAFRDFIDRIVEEEETREPTEEELAELEDEEKWHEYHLELERRKSSFSGMGKLAWIIFPIQYGVGVWYVDLAVNGSVKPDGMLIPFLLSTMFGILMFIMVKWMSWKQILLFHGISFFGFCFISSSDMETDPTYLATQGLLVASVFSVIFIVPAYFIIRFLRKNRDEKSMPIPPSRGQHMT